MDKDFYTAALTAGAIAIGFSGTFLQFRIQREANYYRQPVASFEKAISLKKGEGKPGEKAGTDAFVGLSHFSSSFLLIILGVLIQVVFGFCLPLMALANPNFAYTSPRVVAAGLVVGLVVVLGYFACELIHYQVLSNRLLNDEKEWGKEWPVVGMTLVLALLFGAAAFHWSTTP